MSTVGTPLLWDGFAIIVATILAVGLSLQGQCDSHNMTMKQTTNWPILWVTLSLLFSAVSWWCLIRTQGRAVTDP